MNFKVQTVYLAKRETRRQLKMSSVRRSCGCRHRQFRTSRQQFRSTHTNAPCGSGSAASLARGAQRGVSQRADSAGFKQARGDLAPNHTARRNRPLFDVKPNIRTASTYWALNKSQPSLTKTPLSSIAYRRAYFPRPESTGDAPELPIPYYNAPAVILPQGVRCAGAGAPCQIPFEHRQRMLAKAVADMRERGEPVSENIANVLDFSQCL